MQITKFCFTLAAALAFTRIAAGANCLSNAVVSGQILNAWQAHSSFNNGLGLGCPLTMERSSPDGGRFQTFEYGQIVATPKPGYANDLWVITVTVEQEGQLDWVDV